MTKRDYEALAAAIRGTFEAVQGADRTMESEYADGWIGAVEHCKREFAETLAADNPRFDRARFLAACQS